MKKVYLIAVVVALVAGFATYMFATQIQEKTTIKDADTVQVIVPIEDIPANVKITEDMFLEDSAKFTVKTVIAADASENSVKSQDEMIDKVTIDTLYAGDQINNQRVVDLESQDVALSLKLPEGKVALSMTASSIQGVDGYISEGDTVNVIITKQNEKTGEYESEIGYENLEILRVTTNTANTSATSQGNIITEYSTVTVAVTEEQALELHNIEMNHSDYKFLLNPRTPDMKEAG